jgi:diketogulonate reductase-like aldo/keto reductase
LLWEGDTIDFCRQKGIAIEAYSPMARGDERLIKNETAIAIAKRHNKTVPQVALRWNFQHGFIVLPKSKTQSRIVENFNITDFELSK